MSLTQRSISLNARTQKHEEIILNRRKFTTNAQGDWRRDVIANILVPVKIKNWVLVFTKKNYEQAKKFALCLIEIGFDLRYKINTPWDDQFA